MKLLKSVVRFFMGCLVLATGIFTGYFIGLTSLGQFLPRLLAVGTVFSFLIALYSALRSSHLNKDVVDDNTFFLLCLFICAAALGSSISAPPLGHMALDRFARFIPFSDANGYYGQVLNWPDKSFNSWNSRRPLNAVLDIMEFQLGGSTLLGMILLRVVLAALALAAFIAALALIVGRSAAFSTGFVLLSWTWPYAASMLSEINGITISSAGYALLLVALAQNSKNFAYLGLFALVLAGIFRPYNPLMPGFFAFVVIMIITKNWRKGFKEAILVVFAATALFFVIPKIIYLTYGNRDGAIYGNTGYTVLGLARGTGWEEASAYINSKALNLSEQQRNALSYEEAIKTVQKDVRPMGKAMMNSSLQVLFISQREFGFAMGFSRNIPDSAKQNQAGLLRYLMSTPSIWFSSLFIIISVILTFRNLKKGTFAGLLCVITIVAFISIAPFIFQDAGWRVVATLYPGFALLITAIPMSIRYRKKSSITIEEPSSQIQNAAYIPMALIGIVLIAIPYPAISRFFARDTKSSAQAVTVDVRNEEPAHWTGLNRAVVSPQELLTWSINGRYKDWIAVIEQYGKVLRQVRLEKDGIVLLYQPTSVMLDRPVAFGTTGIKLRVMPYIEQ